MRAKQPSVEQIRRVAVEHNSQVVDCFEDYYQAMAHDRFSNAFTYGRFEVDVALDEQVKQFLNL